MSQGISPELLKDKFFKIRKMQYNTYQVDHPNIKGQLRVITVPLNILEIPESLIPPEAKSGFPSFAIGSQTLVSFTNRGDKRQPSTEQLSADDYKKAKKVEITSYAQDSVSEPWNEIIVEGNPPILLKIRTILTKLDWLVDHTNQFGDPVLWALTQVTNSVSIASTGEAGLA